MIASVASRTMRAIGMLASMRHCRSLFWHWRAPPPPRDETFHGADGRALPRRDARRTFGETPGVGGGASRAGLRASRNPRPRSLEARRALHVRSGARHAEERRLGRADSDGVAVRREAAAFLLAGFGHPLPRLAAAAAARRRSPREPLIPPREWRRDCGRRAMVLGRWC